MLEVNGSFVKDDAPIKIGNTIAMITPPLNDEYWLARVPVSDSQAIVCFPKFGTIGIGFQHEEDWNTNLPYTSDAERIFNHIRHNKGDDTIEDAACIAAIQELQKFAAAVKQGS